MSKKIHIGSIIEVTIDENRQPYFKLHHNYKNKKYFEVKDIDKYGRLIIDAYYYTSDGVLDNRILPEFVILNEKMTRVNKIKNIKNLNS